MRAGTSHSLVRGSRDSCPPCVEQSSLSGVSSFPVGHVEPEQLRRHQSDGLPSTRPSSMSGSVTVRKLLAKISGQKEWVCGVSVDRENSFSFPAGFER
jgi:hypothetical protein